MGRVENTVHPSPVSSGYNNKKKNSFENDMANKAIFKTSSNGNKDISGTDKTTQNEPPAKDTKFQKLKVKMEIFGWLLGYFSFLALGGFCINAIEAENDKCVKNDYRLKLLAVLAKHGKQHNDSMVLEILDAATKAHSVKGLYLADLSAEVESTWTFSGGLFFCATLISTIGMYFDKIRSV